ncbi:MAG: lysophospholipid acyltransferase family protein [Deltaproteobacteria bacterium]|nr:lysophospholipid acyltransferase family protein [Deltaproteobacteria bacterium]
MSGFFDGEKLRSSAQRFFLVAINLIPLECRICLMEGLGQILFTLDGRHRRIALRNLALAFGAKNGEELTALARSTFRNLGRVLAEFSFIPLLTEKNMEQYILFEGAENFYRAYEKGKGILFLTAHFGNWEWMAASFPLRFHRPCHVIVRPLDSPFFDGLVERLRTWTGNHTVPKEKSMGRILRILKEGGIIGVLLDQNVAWQEGVFVDFFGELACTNAGMALLALKTGAPVLPVFNIRQPDGRYRVVIEPEVPLIRTEDRDLDVEKNTELFTKIIERFVQDHPDHWFWLHQRWKTRPWQAKKLKEQ